MNADGVRQLMGRGAAETLDLVDDDVAGALEEYVLATERCLEALHSKLGLVRTLTVMVSVVATGAAARENP